MKKAVLFLLTACFLACLTGCAPEETLPPPETTVPPTTQATLPPATTSPTQPPYPFESGHHLMRYDSETWGDYLEYYLHVPENAEEGLPLVIFLHGDGEVGNTEGLACYGLMKKAREYYGEEFPFIAITPCTRTISWVQDSIQGTLTELIAQVASDCRVDTKKIIITGHSRGAIGVWNLISLYGDYFSAAVPVSCDCGDRRIDYRKAAAVPVWAVVGGTGDLDKKYASSMCWMCDQITAAGGSAQFTILWDNYHNETCENAFTEELFQWMLSQ